jgi:hypothetical protein
MYDLDYEIDQQKCQINLVHHQVMMLTFYFEIEGLWYHIYCKEWIKSFYLSNSKFVDCLKGGWSFFYLRNS